MTGAITKTITALEQCINAFDMLDTLKGTNIANYADTLIYQDAVEALTELKAFKEGVNKIEHKVDPETDQFHAPSWIIELAYLAQEGVKE